ncbi:solute carrier family 2, facilitated glucose transporter member 3-like [Styela clava]
MRSSRSSSQSSTAEMVSPKANELNEDEEKYRPRLTFYAAWTASFVSLVGLWQYGFSIGSINAAYGPVTDAIRQQYEGRFNMTIPSSFVDAIWVTSSAAYPIGGIIGCLFVGPIVRKFGRLRGLLLGHVITVFFSILLGLVGVLNSPELLILSRVGIGFTSGAIGTGISVMYVIEISPQHLRGAFGSLISVGISFGLIGGNVLGLPQALGNSRFWPLLCSITGLPSVIFILLYKTLPESPRKVFMEDRNEEKAIQILRRLNGVQDVSRDLIQMNQERNSLETSQQMTVKQLISSAALRSSVIAALVISSAQQVTGLNGVSFNMNNIYLQAGIQQSYVHYCSIGVTILILFFQLFSVGLTEKYGRKILLTSGYAIEGMSLILLTVSIELRQHSNAFSFVAVGASLGFWVGFGLGPGPATLLVVAEFFEQTSRSAAVTVSTIVLWIGFVLTVVVTPYMMAAMGGYTFLPYGIVALLSVAFIYYKVPETKNRSFSEIQRSFGKKMEVITEVTDESSI